MSDRFIGALRRIVGCFQLSTVAGVALLILQIMSACTHADPIPLKTRDVQEMFAAAAPVVVTHFRGKPFTVPPHLLDPNGTSSDPSCKNSATGKGCLILLPFFLPIITAEANASQERIEIFRESFLLRDPAAELQKQFASTVSQALHLPPIRVIPHTVETEYPSLLTDHGLVFIFRTTEWRLEATESDYANYAPTASWGSGKVDTVRLYLLYATDVELISEPTGTFLWRDRCNFDSRTKEHPILTFGELRAEDGRALKNLSELAAEFCGSRLTATFLKEFASLQSAKN